MPTFDYVGRDPRGIPIHGRTEAADAPRARVRLQHQGITVTGLTGRPAARWPVKRVAGPADVAMLTYDLAMLLGAGLPLMQALEVLAEQAPEGRLRDVLHSAAREIADGRKFSEALGRYPDLFSSMYLGIVSNGEVTGRLDQALERLAGFLERDLEFRRKVRDTLIYPALVLSMAGVVLTIFLMYIIPAFDRVYQRAGVSLPFLTRALVAWSRVFRASLPLVAAVIVALLLRPIRQGVWAKVAVPVQPLLLRLPHVGALTRLALQSRFAHSMAMMLQSGVPLLSALDVTGQIGRPSEFGGVVASLRRSITDGRRLTDAMRDTRWFAPMFVRIASVGEETGRLDTMMARAATILDRDLDLHLRRFLTFLEPALTLLVGALVGVILLALYLPIFGLSRTLVH